MSHFYATIPASSRKTMATACGTKTTGLAVQAASFDGSIRVQLWHDEESKVDRFAISHERWQGAGITMLIATGIIGKDGLEDV